MSGKGDTRRPRQVSREEYAANWDAVFGAFFTQGVDADGTAWLRVKKQGPVDDVVVPPDWLREEPPGNTG